MRRQGSVPVVGNPGSVPVVGNPGTVSEVGYILTNTCNEFTNYK